MEELGIWDYANGVNRFVLYVGAMLAVGLALFSLALEMVQGYVAKAGVIAAAMTGVSLILGVGLGGVAITGEGGLFTAGNWTLGAQTSLSSSAAVGIGGAACLVIGYVREGRAWLSLGAVITVLSFVMTGHAASAPPAMLMAPTVGLHLLAAAFWFGALVPLFTATRAKSPVEAGFLMGRFSRLAVVGVGMLLVTGVAISWVQTAALSGLFTTPYGGRLLAKLVLFAGLLGLATYNKWILTPRLARNDADAARGLRRSIAWELALFIAVLAVAALLSLSAPPRG